MQTTKGERCFLSPFVRRILLHRYMNFYYFLRLINQTIAPATNRIKKVTQKMAAGRGSSSALLAIAFCRMKISTNSQTAQPSHSCHERFLISITYLSLIGISFFITCRCYLCRIQAGRAATILRSPSVRRNQRHHPCFGRSHPRLELWMHQP